MLPIEPTTPEELATHLSEASSQRQTIHLGGRSTSRCDVAISTRRMNRILIYNPSDLTISVEAGITYAALSTALAAHGQMIPLDPPNPDTATIGGILASNISGPRTRLYGTARDMVIGMTFATLEGKLVQTGGMVVKNVAGLDMAKLMIGSFGTLAAIAVANFRLHPIPANTRTFEWKFDAVPAAIAARDRVLKSQLQPMAVDLTKEDGKYRLLVQAGGSTAVLARYSRELSDARAIEGEEETEIWRQIREFSRMAIPCKLTEVGALLESLPGPAIARAGSGVVYVEHAPGLLTHHEISATDLKIKRMMDPHGLLNPGR